MVGNGVLDDGKPQPRAADGPGMALVHPVEPLKDPALICRGDADASVRHSQCHSSGCFCYCNGDAAAGDIVLHGVFAEVADGLAQKPPHTGKGSRRAVDGQRDVLRLRRGGQGGGSLLRQPR